MQFIFYSRGWEDNWERAGKLINKESFMDNKKMVKKLVVDCAVGEKGRVIDWSKKLLADVTLVDDI